ncbi:MAG TPA: hypothetical protein VFE54_08150 [Mucilaginibacter sp.]|jgi:hypothetical protein|nr:hypothetical protein [Mucilaginibacter sp.]
MDNNEKTTRPVDGEARRKFVLGFGILSAFAAVTAAIDIPFFFKKISKSAPKKKTVKMLTEDGKLVEIDASLMASGKKKVTNTELQHWIKK